MGEGRGLGTCWWGVPTELPTEPGSVGWGDSSRLMASASPLKAQHVWELDSFIQNDFVAPNIQSFGKWYLNPLIHVSVL